MHRPLGFQYSAIILLALFTASCDGATEPSPSEPPPEPPPVAARLTAATATTLTGTVGTELLPTPVVRATDAHGGAVVGVPITFDVGNGSGSIATAADTTDAYGLAGPGRWALGPVAGAQTLTARAAGVAVVIFTATAAAGPVAQVHALSGENQFASAGEPLGMALEVRVTDEFDNGIAGAPVTFTVTAGGGTIASGPAATDAAGVAASGVWTLGPETGEQQVQASSGSASVIFSAIAISPSSGKEGRLAFVSVVDGNADIYTVNADGTGVQRLTTDPGADVQPAWAPAGDKIAFVAERNGTGRIYSMNADGGNVTALTPDRTDSSEPSWSPDPGGTELVYTTLRNGSDDVVSIDTRTGSISVLAGLPGYDSEPDWSPDGRRLAFVSDYDAYDFVYDIYTINANGTGLVKITQSFDLGARGIRYYLHPSWSPDGTLIAFVWGEFLSFPTDMRFHVAVMAPDGSGARDLAWAGDIDTYSLFSPGSLTWSPDGGGIAFSFADCAGSTGGGCSQSVKYVPLAGGEAVTLIPNGHSPSWH